jgi:transcription-repair coupling factor (superfamily II helicase)
VQGDTALRDDIGLWRQKGFSVLLYAGRHAERLHDILSDLGIEAPVTQKLGRDIVEREIIITGQTIPRGFEYPELRLAVVSVRNIVRRQNRQSTRITD